MPFLPFPLCSVCVASAGTKLYVSDGADYNSTAFYTFADRHGENVGLGKRLLVLDTGNLTAGWRRLPDLPGAPRFIHAFSPVAAGAKLLVLGGTAANGSTVVDNWLFDTASETWDPPDTVPDLPLSSGNFQTNGHASFRDRYVLLVGGYQYGQVYNPDGMTRAPYGQPGRMCPPGVSATGCHRQCAASASVVNETYMGGWAHEYNNDVFVFDSQDRVFGTVQATPSSEPSLLPAGRGRLTTNDNLP